ncbi:hypothetical protein O0555_21195 [Brevibacillus laterosporus]|uniref:hypothetical protein n=1 Tax=Brevibacillus laterosporus TaxID=1465 RepID=UPI00215CD2EA|nr:hypothetical protein [Brevibacillus laterosporus]MCR8939820.1 hypothetical protein [Brevibacillus laterosporus]MCZ0842460.1 hypothetical protein [Brevibacillus laterosporus]MCZ0846457.1 hypothetical protein [Brevibacillus laterosporus]
MIFADDVVAYICDKVLKDAALDVFYLVTLNPNGISKIDILKEYQTRMGLDLTPNKLSQKYRSTVEEGIAVLLGTTFIDYYPDGTSFKYFLTDNGNLVIPKMGRILKEKPDLVKTSNIISKVMEGEAKQ